MPETNIPSGNLRFAGKTHGVRNYILTWFDDPEDWSFKQFVSQEQLEVFAAENNLLIVENSHARDHCPPHS